MCSEIVRYEQNVQHFSRGNKIEYEMTTQRQSSTHPQTYIHHSESPIVRDVRMNLHLPADAACSQRQSWYYHRRYRQLLEVESMFEYLCYVNNDCYKVQYENGQLLITSYVMKHMVPTYTGVKQKDTEIGVHKISCNKSAKNMVNSRNETLHSSSCEK